MLTDLADCRWNQGPHQQGSRQAFWPHCQASSSEVGCKGCIVIHAISCNHSLHYSHLLATSQIACAQETIGRIPVDAHAECENPAVTRTRGNWIGFTPWYRNDLGMIHECARFVRSAQGKHADYCSFILEDSWSCVRWMPWCCKGPSYKLTKLDFITACGLVRNAMNNTEKMKMWKWVIQSSTTLRCEFCRSIDILNHLIHLEILYDYTIRPDKDVNMIIHNIYIYVYCIHIRMYISFEKS